MQRLTWFFGRTEFTACLHEDVISNKSRTWVKDIMVVPEWLCMGTHLFLFKISAFFYEEWGQNSCAWWASGDSKALGTYVWSPGSDLSWTLGTLLAAAKRDKVDGQRMNRRAKTHASAGLCLPRVTVPGVGEAAMFCQTNIRTWSWTD